MTSRLRSWASVVLVAGLLLVACGGCSESPTGEQLAGSLLTADEVGLQWQAEFSGALTDDMR